MGAASSRAAGAAAPGSDLDIEDGRERPFEMWPELEDQLEQSYLCHDIGEEDAVPYEVMEPVLRHHLMECGLTEYICRFCTREGMLDSFAVSPYLRKRGLNLARPLGMREWKMLMLCWIELVQDAQAKDVRKWQHDLTYMQYQQAVDYKKSMELFQFHYINHLEEYYKAIEEEHKKEQEEREEWERNNKLQEDFYNEQMGFVAKANEEAVQAWGEAFKHQKSATEQYLKWIRPHRKDAKTITFSYQLPTDKIIGPISGGVRAPARFRRTKQ